MLSKKFVRYEKEGVEAIIRNRRQESSLFNNKVNHRNVLSAVHSEMINFYTMGVEMIGENFTGMDGKLNEMFNIFFESKMLMIDKDRYFVVKISLNKKNKIFYDKYKTFIIIGIWDPHRGVLVATLLGNMRVLKEEYEMKSDDFINNERKSSSMDINISKLINKGFLVFSVNSTPEEVYNIIKEKSDASLNYQFSPEHIIPIENFDKNYYHRAS